MIYLNIDKLPSGFKPYPFKSFQMKAISLEQAMRLGPKPSIQAVRDVIKELVLDVAGSLLAPPDILALVATLSFNVKSDRSWTMSVGCPHCKKRISQHLTLADFPPVPSFEPDDPYPLELATDEHIYRLGYCSVDDYNTIDPDDVSSILAAYTLSIDDITDKGTILQMYKDCTDLEMLALLRNAVLKYFVVDKTVKHMACPHCEQEFDLPLSALEVAHYVPFPDSAGTGKYKINFRL